MRPQGAAHRKPRGLARLGLCIHFFHVPAGRIAVADCHGYLQVHACKLCSQIAALVDPLGEFCVCPHCTPLRLMRRVLSALAWACSLLSIEIERLGSGAKFA